MNEEILTFEDLSNVLGDIDSSLSFLFKNSSKHKNIHSSVEALLDYEDRDATRERLERYKGELESRKAAEVVLPFDPERKVLAKVWEWFHDNTGRKVILSIRVDPSIIGGATVSFEGRRFDGSVGSKIDEYFEGAAK